jgi:hypothetical protein
MPPEEQHDRDVVIRFKRETLILAASLLFLGLAVLLAVLFPGGGVGSPAATSTSQTRATSPAVAQLDRTTTGGVAAPTAQNPGAYPGPQGGSGAQTNATAPGGATEGTGAYPEPQGNTGAPSAAPTTGNESAITAAPFSPERPTSAPPGQSGYPAPDDGLPVPEVPEATDVPGAGNPPTARTIAPTQPPSQSAPQSTPARQPTPARQATPVQSQPTPEPSSTPVPPTPTPRPFQSTDGGATATPVGPSATPVPPAPAVNVLRGEVRWTAAQSPLILGVDQQIAPGAALIIEPGVEVRLLPGVAIYADGSIFALGQPGNPVRFVSHTGQRWDGIYGRPGSTISLEHTDIRGGGTGGTVLGSTGGALTVRDSHFTDNGGHILVQDSRLEMRNTEISGNDMPYGAAVDATYTSGGNVTLTGNRIGGNRMSAGAPPVQINNQNTMVVNMTIQGNLLIGQTGPDLVLSTNGPLQGDLSCNTWINGTNGLSIRSQTIQVPGFALNVYNNAIEDHTPPIIPIYLEYGIGRGATSEVALDMRNNWWNNPLGPYDPERHADGRGEAVGNNIAFEPWLTARPACAPHP